jgi:gas vesicle protein/inorganic pyrophosphatase
METTLGPINVTYLINNDDFSRNTNKVKTEIKGVTATATDEAAKMDQLYKKLGTALAGYFSIQAAAGLITSIATVRGEFQQLEISLETILKSKEKADQLLAEVVQLAAKTPFSLQEVGQGTKQLLAYGFEGDKVVGVLKRLGDVSAGLSIPLGDLAFLYGTTRVQGRLFAKDLQQFTGRGIPLIAELAKQFQVTESEVTNLVSAGKVGFKEVETAINSLTNEGGTFFNLMEKQSASITGKISNLGDAFDRMYNSIGQSNEGVIADSLDGVIGLVDNYQDVLDVLEVLAITYGTYRAALILTSVASKVLAAANSGLTVATILQQKWTILATRAQALLNTTMLANPFVAAATALSALVAAFVIFNRSNTEAVQVSEDFKKAIRDEIKASEDLFKALKKTNQGSEDRAKAIELINATYKDYLPKQLTEVSNLEEIEKAQKAVNTAIGESIFLRTQEADLSALREGTQAYAEDFSDAISDIIKDAGVSNTVAGQLSAEFEKALTELSEFSEQPIAQVQERLSKVLRDFGIDFSLFGSGGDISSLNFQDLIKDTQAYAGAINREKTATEGLGEAKTAYLKQLGLINDGQEESTGGAEKEIITLRKLKEQLNELQEARETIDITSTEALAANARATAAVQNQIAALEIKTAKQRDAESKKTELELLKERLDAKKAAYADYYTAIELLGKDTADVQFADLRKEAETYVDYLNKVKTGIDPNSSDSGRQQILVERELQVATGALSPLEVLKLEVEQMKQVYADFESFKAKFGEEKAREQFGNQLSEYENYLAFLKQKTLANQDAFTGVMGNTATDGQREIVKFLNEETTEAVRSQEQSFIDLLAKYQDYNAERLRLEQAYQADRKELEAAGKFDELAELELKYQGDVDALDDANLERLDSYKELYAGVERLTVSSARRLISIAKNLLSTQDMSQEKAAEIAAFIRELEREINKLDLQDYARLGQALGNLGGALVKFGSDVGSSKIAGIGSLFSGLAQGVNNLLVSFDKDASKSDKIIAGVNGLIQVIDMLGTAARARREAEEAYYKSIIGFQNQYNLTLNEQLRLQSILGESVFLTDYEGRVRDALSALGDASKNYDAALGKLVDGKAIAGQRSAIDLGAIGSGIAGGAAFGAAIGTVVPVIGNIVGAVVGGIVGGIAGLFGGKKKKDVLLPILTEYPELLTQTESGVKKFNKALAESLIANNLVDDATKDILRNIIQWEDAMEAAREQIRDVVSDLAGGLGTELRNSLVEAFKAGEDAALRMGESVEKVLEDIISQLLFNRIFAETFAQLEDDLVEALASGDINQTTEVFKDFFNQAKGLSDTYYDSLAAAQAAAGEAGFDLFKPEGGSSQQTGLSGGIRRELTEATGSELAGLFRGFYDISKRTFTLTEGMLEVEKQHYQATLEGLTYWAAIEKNTQDTVGRLDEALVELKEIRKNTKAGSGSRDLGIDG